MNKFINYSEIMHYLIDDKKQAEKGGEIVQAIAARQIDPYSAAEQILQRLEVR